jgi:hypothetical protein
MNNACKVCGATESQALAYARTLGLQPELQGGLYTCCQIAAWAEEQQSAWWAATQEDSKRVDDLSRPPESGEAEAVLVPVRLRRAPVPWFRKPEDLR